MIPERRAALEAAIQAASQKGPTGSSLAGVGWSSVDSERSERAFGGVFSDEPDDVLLGATCRVARGLATVPLVILEPSTEGRLAGLLARHGEGLVVTWFAADGSVAGGDLRPGPFGPERILSGSVRAGHLMLLCGPETGTIADMTDHHAEHAPVSLRAAVPTDADTIASLFTDEGYPAGPSDIVARLERFGSAHSRVVVAEHDEALIGFIAVHAMPRFEHDDRILRILALVVDPGARERGVGRALIAEAERIGTELGAAFVEITAGHHRPEARHLYESQGYDGTVAAYLRKKL